MSHAKIVRLRQYREEANMKSEAYSMQGNITLGKLFMHWVSFSFAPPGDVDALEDLRRRHPIFPILSNSHHHCWLLITNK